jgi:hypothetical protein
VFFCNQLWLQEIISKLCASAEVSTYHYAKSKTGIRNIGSVSNSNPNRRTDFFEDHCAVQVFEALGQQIYQIHQSDSTGNHIRREGISGLGFLLYRVPIDESIGLWNRVRE